MKEPEQGDLFAGDARSIDVEARTLRQPGLDTKCPHKFADTMTDWGMPYGVRRTRTCELCGEIRGRA